MTFGTLPGIGMLASTGMDYQYVVLPPLQFYNIMEQLIEAGVSSLYTQSMPESGELMFSYQRCEEFSKLNLPNMTISFTRGYEG